MWTGIFPGPLNGKNGRHPLPEPTAFIAWLGRMGVANGSQVVGYDNAGGTYGARLWWMLRWVGHRNVAVVDGGWQAWTAAGHPVTKELPAPTPDKFSGKPDRSWVDAATVAQAPQFQGNGPDRRAQQRPLPWP